jgi:hypothetical protein
MSDPYVAERRALVEAVERGAGHLDATVRTAIVNRARGRDAGPIPKALVGLVDRVAHDAPAIGDVDVDAVLAAGFDEEAVFEAIVAAALGASLAPLERVDVLLEGRA